MTEIDKWIDSVNESCECSECGQVVSSGSFHTEYQWLYILLTTIALLVWALLDFPLVVIA